MFGEHLTRDNPLLSPPTNTFACGRFLQLIAQGEAHGKAESNSSAPARAETQAVEGFLRASLAGNTQRAYVSDLNMFESWGGCIPATPSTVAGYLASQADTLSVATLVRRLASISKAHEAKNMPNPTRSELVKATLRGIRRTKGIAQHQATPLVAESLFRALDAMGDDTSSLRDRAVMSVGFAGALRRTELIGLNMEDVEAVRQGIVLHLRRSKVDQVGKGTKIAIPHGRTRYCPVAALDAWLKQAGIDNGPLFRPVDRHGHISSERLSGGAVSLIVRKRVTAAGIDPSNYSGHSLRSGLATSAAQAGVSAWKICKQTRHSTVEGVARYVRDAELFIGNAAGALL